MIEIVTGTELDAEGQPQELVDTFDGPTVSFLTENSGTLVIFESPQKPWAAYARGAWQKVRQS